MRLIIVCNFCIQAMGREVIQLQSRECLSQSCKSVSFVSQNLSRTEKSYRICIYLKLYDILLPLYKAKL